MQYGLTGEADGRDVRHGQPGPPAPAARRPSDCARVIRSLCSANTAGSGPSKFQASASDRGSGAGSRACPRRRDKARAVRRPRSVFAIPLRRSATSMLPVEDGAGHQADAPCHSPQDTPQRAPHPHARPKLGDAGLCVARGKDAVGEQGPGRLPRGRSSKPRSG